MLFDHIWTFIPNMPCFFHWIGRLSAPIFIFCCILGFENTTNKKIYILRIYIFNVFIGILNIIYPIEMNFIKTLSLITILCAIVYLRELKYKHASLILFLFFTYQIVTSILFLLNTSITYEYKVLLSNISLNLLYLDGGIFFLALGLCMYIYKTDKKKLFISLVVLTILYLIIYDTNVILRAMRFAQRNFSVFKNLTDSERPFYIVKAILGFHPAFNATNLLYDDPQWMMLFSLPFIFLYNGKKGRNMKFIFYIFYPCHIVLLYFISLHLC